MTVQDPFIEGLRRALDERPDLTPASLSLAAGLDVSTVRKMFGGQSQTPKHSTMQKLARALGMSVEQITLQTGPAPADQKSQHGNLAEDAQPFIHATPDQTAAVRALFGHAGRNIAITHCASTWLPDLGIAAGDLIVCDLARLPAPGELALVTQSDDAGHSVSLIRRYLPPWLVASGPPGTAPAQVSDPGIAVRHPVVGIIRAPAAPK